MTLLKKDDMEVMAPKLNARVRVHPRLRGVVRRAAQLSNQTEEPEIIIPFDPEDPMIPEEFPEPEEFKMAQ
jgi:hypothetical protein